MFITVIFLTTYKKFEYGLFEQTDSLIKYNYCDMETYFYTLTLLLLSFCQLYALRKLSWQGNYQRITMKLTTSFLLCLQQQTY